MEGRWLVTVDDNGRVDYQPLITPPKADPDWDEHFGPNGEVLGAGHDA